MQEIVDTHPLIVRFINWTKRRSLPGFSKVPIYDVGVFIINEIRRDSLVTRANSIAFSFFLSLFPTLLVFFTLIPFVLPFFQDYIIPFIADDLIHRNAVGSVDFNATILAQFTELINQVKVIPKNVHTQLLGFIQNILLEPRFGALSLGFLLALFFASNGMMSMMRGFEKTQTHKQTFRRWNAIQKRIIALELTLLIGFLVIAAILFIILGNTVITWFFGLIHIGSLTHLSIQILRYVTMFFLFYFGIAIIYRRGVPARQKFDYFSPGTTFATVLSLVSSLIFALYVNQYSKYNDLYGSIGTFIVIMLWIQLNAFVLLVGFELNASIAINRDLKKQIPEPVSTEEASKVIIEILEEEVPLEEESRIDETVAQNLSKNQK